MTRYYLKWSIIVGHTTLQGAMCLLLITCSNLLVRKREFYKNNSGDLDNIEWLYLKLQNTKFLTPMGSKIISEVKGVIKIKCLQKIKIHLYINSQVYTFSHLKSFMN